MLVSELSLSLWLGARSASSLLVVNVRIGRSAAHKPGSRPSMIAPSYRRDRTSRSRAMVHEVDRTRLARLVTSLVSAREPRPSRDSGWLSVRALFMFGLFSQPSVALRLACSGPELAGELTVEEQERTGQAHARGRTGWPLPKSAHVSDECFSSLVRALSDALFTEFRARSGRLYIVRSSEHSPPTHRWLSPETQRRRPLG